MVSHRIPELDKVKSRSYSEFCNLEDAKLASTLCLASGDCGSFPPACWVSAYKHAKAPTEMGLRTNMLVLISLKIFRYTCNT